MKQRNNSLNKWKNFKKSSKGITLIAIVITVIVLLILAGVTIATLTGDNGILTRAQDSKEQTEVGDEKETVGLAVNADLITNEGEKNTKEGIQTELDTIKGINKTRVIKNGRNDYIVIFLDTNRKYKVDGNKNIDGPVDIEFIEDDYAGDITKNGTLDGESNPYQINCIEDLVAFSNMSETNNFENKKVILKRDLDFESELSYADWERKDYGDVNKDGNIDALMMELVTGIGFNPIDNFKGNFDGNGKYINNLYEKNNESNQQNLGFFSSIGSNAVIQNLFVTGDIYDEIGLSVGGIVGVVKNNSINITVANNMFSGKITGQNVVGGIIGYVMYSNVSINQCENRADSISKNYIAGIVGQAHNSTLKVMNSLNSGNIKLLATDYTYVSAGGILGGIDSTNIEEQYVEIFNCYNSGNIYNASSNVYCAAGGILGNTTNFGENIIIANCYNIGKTTAKYQFITNFSGGILGGFWYNQYEANIKHCYYDGIASDRSVGGIISEYAQKLSQLQIKGQETIEDEDGNSKTLLELLNGYIENNPDSLDTTQWKKWVQNEEGYPVLDI